MIEVRLLKRKAKWVDSQGKEKRGWSWAARWWEDVVDADGQRKKKERVRSLKTKDRQVALKMAVAIQAEFNQVPSPVSLPVPLRLGWELAMDRYVHFSSRLARTTIRGRKTGWKAFWTWASALESPVTDLGELTKLHVLEYQRASELEPSTVNVYLASCAMVVSALIELRLFGGDNAFQVRALPEDDSDRDWMTEAEVEIFVDRAFEYSVDLGLFVALGVYAGLRAPSEVIAVRWDWISFPSREDETGYIRIPKSDDRFRPKNKRERVVPLSPALARRLLPHRGVPRAFVIAPFVTEWVGDYRWCGFTKGFRALRGAIPGKLITPYCLRRTFASLCAVRGIDLYRIMQWMGHKDVKMLARYAHLAPGDSEIRRLFSDAKEEKHHG